MRIVYIAKHRSGGNNDEDAISHALVKLGHEVIKLNERDGKKATGYNPDICLFHKWEDINTLERIAYTKVFWWFDLVEWIDPALEGRDRLRRKWMNRIIPHVDLGFCTDGDWVHKDISGKLHVLRQGADERFTDKIFTKYVYDILFTGIGSQGGSQRKSFVQELKDKYGTSFKHVSTGIYGPQLRSEIGKSKIVVAPDSPVTDNYWSNRVYVMLGFGAFLLHPYCAELAKQYVDGKHIVYYTSREDLHAKIQYYLHPARSAERIGIGAAALDHTKAKHLYRHRCEELIGKINEHANLQHA